MKKEARPFLVDILGSIEKIEEYVKNRSSEEFSKSTQLQDAVMRRLEIIGEAAKNIPADFRRRYPGVPWSRISGLRDVLIHAYFGIVVERVWTVVERDLPELKKKIVKILEETQP